MRVERFTANAARSIAIGLMAIAPAALLPAVYARTLPAHEVAAWLYAYGLGNYVAALHLGIGTSISAQVANESTQAGRAAYLLAGFRLMIVIAGLAAVGVMALDYFGASASPVSQALNGQAWMMLLSSAAVGTALILPLAAFSGYCVGTFNVARLVPLMVLQKSSLVLLCTGAALVFESARSVSLAHLLSGALTMAALVTLVRREIRGDLQDARRLARERSGLIIQLALPAAISGLAQLPLINLHVLLVGKYLPSAIVGFVVVSTALTLFYGMAWAVLSNLLPEFSLDRRTATGTPGRSVALLPAATYLCGLALLASSVAMACGLPGVLTLAITDSFVEADLPGLVVYAIAIVARLATLPWGIAFYAGGHPWIGLVPVLVEASLSAFLAIILLPAYGLPGLASAVLIASLAHTVIAWSMLRGCGLATAPGARPMVSVGCTLASCGGLASLFHATWNGIGEKTWLMGNASMSILITLLAGLAMLAACWHTVVPSLMRKATLQHVAQVFQRFRLVGGGGR